MTVCRVRDPKPKPKSCRDKLVSRRASPGCRKAGWVTIKNNGPRLKAAKKKRKIKIKRHSDLATCIYSTMSVSLWNSSILTLFTMHTMCNFHHDFFFFWKKKKKNGRRARCVLLKFTAATHGMYGLQEAQANWERCFMLQWEKRQVFVKLVLTQQTTKKPTHLPPRGCRKKRRVCKKKSQQKKFFPFPPPSCSLPPTPLQVRQLVCDKLFEPLQVLSVELHVVVSGALHPQRLHGALAALVQRHAVGEVDDLVLRAVDHKDRRCNLGNFVDAAKRGNTGGIFIYIDIYCI